MPYVQYELPDGKTVDVVRLPGAQMTYLMGCR